MTQRADLASADPIAEFSSEEFDNGERLFASDWQFLKSCPKLEILPPDDRMEIAFAGRSNVGKSSLINAVVNQHHLARASTTPGRTQELNFFQTSIANLYVVDMPGYGFAKAPKEIVNQWTELVRMYLAGRRSLARVFLLIDSRHGLKKLDREIMELLDGAAVSYQIVLTKADKVKPTEFAKVRSGILTALKEHPAAFPAVLATSSETVEGIAELRATVARLLSERGQAIHT